MLHENDFLEADGNKLDTLLLNTTYLVWLSIFCLFALTNSYKLRSRDLSVVLLFVCVNSVTITNHGTGLAKQASVQF